MRWLMDIEMPAMDGHEVVEKMRKVEERNNINPLESFKLVMLTVHKDVKNVSKSFFRGGAEAYIPKEHLSGPREVRGGTQRKQNPLNRLQRIQLLRRDCIARAMSSLLFL